MKTFITSAVTAAVLATSNVAMAQWTNHETVDDFTDEVKYTTRSHSKGSNGYSRKYVSSMAVTCDAQGVILTMLGDRYVGFSLNNPVIVRVDKNKPVKLTAVTTGKGGSTTEGVTDLIEQMKAGNTVRFKFTSLTSTSTGTHSLKGFSKAIGNMPCMR